jgi:hypothetical protein
MILLMPLKEIGKSLHISFNIHANILYIFLHLFYFSRVYIPCIYLLNKIDQISIEVSIVSVDCCVAFGHRQEWLPWPASCVLVHHFIT